jgi:hypothetical protein
MKDPSPKPQMMMPETMPFLFGKWSQQILSGIVYANPLQQPKKIEKIKVKVRKSSAWMAKSEPRIPMAQAKVRTL